jgi:hypothetical protein
MKKLEAVLFLDIDGVLNSHQSQIRAHRISLTDIKYNELSDMDQRIKYQTCPICVSNFRVLLDKAPKLKVVISSTWRKGKNIEYFQELFRKLDLDPNCLIGKTPILSREDIRGDEIQEWLEKNPSKKIVILDDNDDMGDFVKNLVQTDEKLGLTIYDVQRVLKKLKIEYKIW